MQFSDGSLSTEGRNRVIVRKGTCLRFSYAVFLLDIVCSCDHHKAQHRLHQEIAAKRDYLRANSTFIFRYLNKRVSILLAPL